MRNRNIHIQVWLSPKEAAAMDRNVKRTKLSRSAYIRQLITGFIPREAPPLDYFAMMRELYRVGNNLNQIAQKAHVLNVIDVQRYDANVREFEAVVKEINAAFILPQHMDHQ